MNTTPTQATIDAGEALLKEKASESGFGFAISTMPEDKLRAFVAEFATAILTAQAADHSQEG